MPASSPWLAVDASTVPAELARDLRHAWEGFLQARPEAAAPAVRGPIVASWRRCVDAGVDPLARSGAPPGTDRGEARQRWAEHPLHAALPIVEHCLSEAGEAADQLTVVSDAEGVLLSVQGSTSTRGRAADDMNFTEGALWSEDGAGTNAVGTALAARHPVQVFAAEHFSEPVQRWTCAAAPVYDPEDEALLGVIDVTGALSTVNANALGLVTATARAIESSLLAALYGRDERFRRRHGGLVDGAGAVRALVTRSGRVVLSSDEAVIAGRLRLPPGGGDLVLPSGDRGIAEPLRDDAGFLVTRLERGRRPRPAGIELRLLGDAPPQVRRDGRAVPLRLRQAELLALLLDHPRGVSADALSVELYGEQGRAGSVRVEVSRLRKALGPCVGSQEYRLLCPVRSDVGRVRELLRDGHVGSALEAYAGPLLPASDAPGVRRGRDELDGWLRSAVLASDDTELLWWWATGPSGEGDLLAWTRALAGLPFADPRRAQAVAHVARMRDELGYPRPMRSSSGPRSSR